MFQARRLVSVAGRGLSSSFGSSPAGPYPICPGVQYHRGVLSMGTVGRWRWSAMAEPPREGETMAGKFVLKKGSSGRFHFNLVAANGQVIATSQAYDRKELALS